MLEERRHFKYYESFSSIHSNPIFPLEEVRLLFAVFSEFARETLGFKVKPRLFLDALKHGGFKAGQNKLRLEVLEWMDKEYPQGVSFNDFMSFLVTETIGEDLKNTSKKEQLILMLSRGSNHLTS